MAVPSESPIELLSSLEDNLRVFRERLFAPDNADVLLRRFRSGAFESALLAIDGMTDSREIDESILMPDKTSRSVSASPS